MPDQWISVNRGEKAMIGRGVQVIRLSGKNRAHMFTGAWVFTTRSTVNVEKTFGTLALTPRSPEFVLAAIVCVAVTFSYRAKANAWSWGQSIAFVSTTSHESNQAPNHFNNRF
jgi:hypothetical protein